MNQEAEQLKEKLATLEENPFGVSFNPVETLEQCFFHSSREVREKAARMAGSFPSERFIEPLFRLVAEDHEMDVRLAALEALGTFLHHGRMVDYHLRDASDRPPDSETDMSQLSAHQFEAIRDFMGEISDRKEWPSRLRAEALQHYAPLEPDHASTLINQFYQSGKPGLIEAALKAVGRVPPDDWDKLLYQEVLRNEYDTRRLSAIEAAGVHDVVEVGPELAALLDQQGRPDFRRAAAEALSRLSWKDAGETLEQYLDDPDESVRRVAQDAMVRRSQPLEKETWEEPR